MPTKRCPPGVFCIENISFTVIIVAFMAFIAIMVYFARPAAAPAPMMQPSMVPPMLHPPSMFQSRANYGVSDAREDVLLNPYVPPLRDDRASLDIR